MKCWNIFYCCVSPAVCIGISTVFLSVIMCLVYVYMHVLLIRTYPLVLHPDVHVREVTCRHFNGFQRYLSHRAAGSGLVMLR